MPTTPSSTLVGVGGPLCDQDLEKRADGLDVIDERIRGRAEDCFCREGITEKVDDGFR
jgi:hypothetical protein